MKTLLPGFFAAILFFSFSSTSIAETNTRVRKTRTTVETTTADSEGDSVEEVDRATGSSWGNVDEPKEKVITASFGNKGLSGLNGCRTEEPAKNVIRDLKDDCKAWVKDQRADLKGKYLTSSCEESCEDCGMSLRRCSVTGTVRYTVKEAK